MGVRSFLLRRAMGRLRITDDIVRHLSTFQRLGETIEVQLPGELLPVGARTVFRALRTRAAAQIGEEWLWPHWLERQLDPGSPAFVPRGHLPFLTNLTARNWTAIGNVSSPWEAVVDPRGLVTPWYDGWSLDWWVGAEDRWHLPSREVAVRQRLVHATPVVETAMRVPGGDVVHRAYAVSGPSELVVVEVENQTPVPVALALAVRPYNPEGLAVIERIELHDGHVVTVDGRVALVLPERTARMTASTFHDGDSLHAVVAGDAGTSLPDVRCEAGLAQAAFIVPLPHRQTVRAIVPLRAERRTRRRGLTRRRVARGPDLPRALPTAAQVASGWRTHGERGVRLELPDTRLAEAVDANRRYLLLFHDGADITPGPLTYHRFWFRDAAYLLAAMGRYGLHDEVAQVLRTWPERQHVDGFFFSQRQEWDSNGAALWSLAEHWRLTRDTDLVAGMTHSIAKGAHWIERKRRSKRRRRDPALAGLLPASISAEHLGPFDYFYWDDFWCLKGMEDAATLLRVAGARESAAEVATEAAAFRRDLDASLALVAERLGTPAIPAGPRRRIDPGVVGSLVACHPLGLMAPDDPRIMATADVLRGRFTRGPAFYQAISHTGLGTYLTLQLAFVELEAGDRRALERLRWLLDAATDTWTWPEAIHPQLGGGCMGDGHHGWAAADFLSFVRTLLVRETGDGGVALCSLLPDGWEGQGLEVHHAPTHAGRLSYALRWHGERPALLWELDPHPDAGAVTITAPGLDPTWSSTDARGEALLAPYAPPSPGSRPSEPPDAGSFA